MAQGLHHHLYSRCARRHRPRARAIPSRLKRLQLPSVDGHDEMSGEIRAGSATYSSSGPIPTHGSSPSLVRRDSAGSRKGQVRRRTAKCRRELRPSGLADAAFFWRTAGVLEARSYPRQLHPPRPGSDLEPAYGLWNAGNAYLIEGERCRVYEVGRHEA